MWYATGMADATDEVIDRSEVDALYALDPSEFVAARDALAKDLKAAGDQDAAAGVKSLKKPTKAAWAINQVARSHPDDVAALLDAGATLRERQAAALSGGDAGALRDAAADRRNAVRTLVGHVVALAGVTVREDASATFEAASVDDEAGVIVASGRLTTTLDRPSDMGFGGMPDPPSRPARPERRQSARATRSARTAVEEDEPPPPTRLDRKRIQKLERVVAAAERTAADAREEIADAERRLRRADDALTAAEAKRDHAAEMLQKARRASEAASRALREARVELSAASDPT